MIYTKIANLKRYQGIDKNLDIAIEYIMNLDVAQLCEGRNEISGETVYGNYFSYDTMTLEETSFEAHQHYTDIHIVIEGTECIGISNTSDLIKTDTDESNDYIGYQGNCRSFSEMTVGDALIAFPEDVHRVKIIAQEKSTIRKLVLKVMTTL